MLRYNESAGTVAFQNGAHGKYFEFDVKNHRYYESPKNDHSAATCWAVGTEKGILKLDFGTRYRPLGGMTKATTVTETTVDYKDGARTKFAVTVPDSEGNAGGTTTHIVQVGANGRLLFSAIPGGVGDDANNATIPDAYTYPNSEPAIKLPSGKSLCPKSGSS